MSHEQTVGGAAVAAGQRDDFADMERLPASRLAELLAPDAGARWTAADGLAALRQQLLCPLMPDLPLFAPHIAPEVERLATLDPERATFSGQLRLRAIREGAASDLSPSISILEAMKRFARHVLRTPENPLCGMPGTILYYTCIAAALVAGARITALSDADLRTGLRNSLNHPCGQCVADVLAAAAELMDRPA